MFKRAVISKLIAELEENAADPGGVLDRFLDSSRPPAVNTLLRRCALARSFDEELYAAVLSKDVDPPMPFGEFIEQPDVQVTARAAKTICSITSPLRERYRQEWQADTTAIEWHRAIAKFEAERNPRDVLNLLYHQVQSEKAEALKTFNSAFDQAENQFDLAQCHSLLAILDDLQGDGLGLELSAAREQKQQIYRSRALFADAYYRSSTYYPRRRALSAFNREQKSGLKRIFHIHATGGMGKTMYLRWPMSRHLIPARVPCAWIDFDNIQHANIAKHPHLLLLPLAQQLNIQMPRTFFTELIVKLQVYSSLVLPPVPGAPPSTQDPGQEIWTSHLNNFVSAIQHDSGIAEVTLLFDTLELVSLEPDDFLPVYDFLTKLLAAPQITLILAGRFDLSQKMPARRCAFQSISTIHHMSRFSERESRRYLRTRQVPNKLVPEIVAKVLEPREAAEVPGCNPFKLSLFAEIVLGRENITAADIRKLPNADLAYLLERVIRRIPDQSLRWVVRYGALPRRLTEDYIAQVLLDPLSEALRGSSKEDELRAFGVQDFPPWYEQDYWAREPEADPKAPALWKALGRYEAERGWISRASSDQATVQFHPEVTDPMRDLLARQRIFRTLQQRSIHYFEELAGREKHRWGEWICEAIFHAVQFDGPAAIAYWKTQLNHENTVADPAFRRRVASEILRREYAEAERKPRRRIPPLQAGEIPTGRPPAEEEIVTPAALVKAHCETARAILNMPEFAVSDTREWAELKRHMTLAAQMQAELGTQAIDPVLDARYQAATCEQDGRRQEAAAILEKALAVVTDPADKFWVCYDLADVETELPNPAIVRHFHDAIALLPQAVAPGVRSADLRIALAVWLTSESQFQAAYEEYHLAVREAGDDVGTRTNLQSHLAWAALKAGDYEGAQGLVEEIQGRNPKRTSAMFRLSAWIYRSVKDPVAAMKAARDALDLANGREEKAHSYDLLALICGDLLQFSGAFAQWNEALKLFSTAGTRSMESAIIDQVAMQADGLGNFREALLTAESGARLPGMSDPELQARLRVEQLLVQARMGDHEAAAKTVQELMQREWTFALRARIVAAVLASEPAQYEEQYLDELCDALARIEPPPARLELLEVLHWRRRPFPDAPSQRRRLLELLPILEERTLGFAARAIVVADVKRLCGYEHAASDLTGRALAILAPRGSAQAAIRAIETRMAVGGSHDWPEMPSDLPDLDFARAAMSLLRAEARIGAGELTGLDEILNSAEKLLAAETQASRWHARLPELRSRLAFARGGQANEGHRQSLLAVEAYRGLQDNASIERVEDMVKDASNVVSSAERPRRAPPPAAVRNRIVISLVRPPALAAPNLESWGGFLTSPSAQGELAKAVADALPPDALQRVSDLGLSFGSGMDSSVPWEWAIPQSVRYLYRTRQDSPSVPADVARWIQSKLLEAGFHVAVDGIFGPATEAAWLAWAGTHNIATQGPDVSALRAIGDAAPGWQKRSRILLIQPRDSQLEAGEAGYASRSGSGAMTFYANWPGVLQVMDEPNSQELSKVLGTFRPHAIHFVGALQSVRGAGRLSFTREFSESGDPVTSQSLARILRVIPSNQPRPFLILDVTRPYSSWEAAHTLCLRNQFASDLLYLEACSGILGAGLAQPWQLDRLGGVIAGALMRNSSMGEMARAIQTLAEGSQSIDDRLAFTSAALFTVEPELPCLSLAV